MNRPTGFFAFLLGLSAMNVSAAAARQSPIYEPLKGVAGTARMIADIVPSDQVTGPSLFDLQIIDGQPALLTGTLDDGVTLTRLLPGVGPQPVWHDDVLLEGEFWGSVRKAHYWSADDQHISRAVLLRTDWTAAGTRPVFAAGREVQPFYDSGRQAGPQFAFVGDSLFFTGVIDAKVSLFRVSGGGTEAALVSEGQARWLTAVGDRLFYLLVQASGAELWTATATAPPVRLAALAPSARPRLLTSTGGRLVFLAGAAGGEELWTSDGTASGTKPVTSFAAPAPFASTTWMRSIPPRVYFVADDILHGQELWSTDGTDLGTKRLTDFGYHAAFDGITSGDSVEELGENVLFAATDGLSPVSVWATDGKGIHQLAPACMPDCPGNLPIEIHRLGERAIFTSRTDAEGSEPWVTDGTIQGTRSLGDLCPGECSSAPRYRSSAGSVGFFEGRTPTGVGFWRTDSTVAGTKLVAEWKPFPSLFTAFGLTAYFWKQSLTAGGQLWQVSAGSPTPALLTSFADRRPGSEPQFIQRLGDAVLFAACGFPPDGLWSANLDGGAAELGSFDQVCGDPYHPARIVVQEQGFFLARAGAWASNQLFSTDGTQGGTIQLTSIRPDQEITRPVASRDRAAFFVNDGERGKEKAVLWSSDGTVAGTRRILDLPANRPRVLQTFPGNDTEFYFFEGAGYQYDIWRSDGTSAGTRILLPDHVPIETPVGDSNFVQMGAATYFFAHAEGRYGDIELWRTEATGSVLLRLFEFGNSVPRTWQVVKTGDRLYFFAAEDGIWSLWQSDGTVGGTNKVRDLEPFLIEKSRSPRAQLSAIAVVGGSLYFAAADEEHGSELWISDGTHDGTRILKDIAFGDVGGAPRSLAVANGRLFFTADDGIHGAELWTTDGTTAGTQMVQDIAPGALSSKPTGISAAGDALLFAADDGVYGREPWWLPLSGGEACVPSPRRLCLGSGRFQVEASWRDFQGHAGLGTAVPLTSDTGYFWFFDPANVEVVTKVLDGTGLNGHRWVFYGALSSVEYTLTVTDAQTGAARRYVNPPGVLASVGDTTAFGPKGATPSTISSRPLGMHFAPLIQFATGEPAAACAESNYRLCLNGNRFAAEISWKDFQGHTGVGHAVSLTGDTGYFWFFDPANVEVVTKVLDGRTLNDKFWVFYGALSSVEYTLTITDTQTGAQRQYKNPSGRLASSADTGAF